jgi:uncharacterized protein YndB with AHSA1/START domain
MPKNISTLNIKASPQKVWEALTKPELVKKWQFGSELITDWKVGGSIRFKAVWEGKVFEQWGTVLEFKPFELIKYSLFAPRPGLEDKLENYFVMNYILKSENGFTHLEIIQEDNRPNAVQEDPQGEENPILKGLKQVVEG